MIRTEISVEFTGILCIFQLIHLEYATDFFLSGPLEVTIIQIKKIMTLRKKYFIS